MSKPRGKPEVDQCRAWLRALDRTGARFVIPEVADYEVRRELLRVGATAGLRRLDALVMAMAYDPITTAAMRLAAEFWALTRRSGLPTAPPEALDGDCILAAQAALVGRSEDQVTIATNNVGHLARFPGIDARRWKTIA
ncbi:MAG: nucleic acid-binding protein [Isosphaeraceae bacterium]